jgi:peptidoglycan/LPS O-acetylase OafA/YrhL
MSSDTSTITAERTVLPTSEPPTLTPAPPAEIRLGALDGMRGLAALTIVIYHQFCAANDPTVRLLHVNILRPLHNGWAAVNLFLVLSGFCLFWPYARNKQKPFQFGEYMKRRTLRIVPAYYASLIVVPLLYFFWKILFPHQDVSQPLPRGIADVLLHLSLLHSLLPATINSWHGATWSLGLEWTWYLLFPVAVWLFRRFGPVRAIAILAGITLTYRLALYLMIGPGDLQPDKAQLNVFYLRSLLPARLFEFGLGMLVAQIISRPVVHRYGKLAFAVSMFLLVAAQIATPVDNFLPVKDGLYGLCFAFAIYASVAHGSNPMKALCESKPMASIGSYSYSLFLFHLPVVSVIAYMMIERKMSPPAVFFCSLLTLPAVLFFSYLMYRLFEKPFMRARA